MFTRMTVRRYYRLLGRSHSRRTINTSAFLFNSHARDASNRSIKFAQPSPPRLPKHLQEEFETLQRQAGTAPSGNIAEDGRELHPDMRRPIQSEFTGDRNPVTGEIGGPKTEPTKHGDWSYGGRVSDF